MGQCFYPVRKLKYLIRWGLEGSLSNNRIDRLNCRNLVKKMDRTMEQIERMRSDAGFIAALDQSGGSTPKALGLYGIDESAYNNDEQMFDLVHAMRARIITSPRFHSDHILGAILFQRTLDSTIEGKPTSCYLWQQKQIVPFLKIDLGLAEEKEGVQLMKPITDMRERLPKAKDLDVFGTKMRSVIKKANVVSIASAVEQQFEFGQIILDHGLVPIIEPEVDIHSPDKAECEKVLISELRRNLEMLKSDLPVMFKLTLPESPGFYSEFSAHSKVLRVVALSGGYPRELANEKLRLNQGMVASFSRALTEGLLADQSEAAFSELLGSSIESIAAASQT